MTMKRIEGRKDQIVGESVGIILVKLWLLAPTQVIRTELQVACLKVARSVTLLSPSTICLQKSIMDVTNVTYQG